MTFAIFLAIVTVLGLVSSDLLQYVILTVVQLQIFSIFQFTFNHKFVLAYIC